jgi:hypothetical protein
MLWCTAGIVLLLNIPFGAWRVRSRRFSAQWFAAVHLPVPFVIALRVGTGLGFTLGAIPVMVGACVAGQYLGGCLAQPAAGRK